LARIAQDIARLHATPWRAVLYLTGGGSRLLSDLLQVPGASGTVLEAQVPYAEASLTALLGSRPDQACSQATALDLASTAFARARTLAPEVPERLIGLGLTASLASDRSKRGKHRVHLAVQTLTHTYWWHLSLAKGHRSRRAEEQMARDLALHALLSIAGLPARLDCTAPDRLSKGSVKAKPLWQALLLGQEPAVRHGPNFAPRVLFPGAFNPLHDGHRAMADVAHQLTSHEVSFEICANNVDKPRLNYWSLAKRLDQFDKQAQVWVTNLPTFSEKAAQFPGVTFLVGADTISRIGNLRYYQDDSRELNRAMTTLAKQGCRFLVFGRNIDGRFQSLADLTLPPTLRTLCQAVPESSFRVDVSSSSLRRQTPY
jgi:hypothetical protein